MANPVTPEKGKRPTTFKDTYLQEGFSVYSRIL